MGNGYHFSVELYKGNTDEPIDTPLTVDDDLSMDAAVYGVQLAFDKGQADKAAIYVSRDGDLLTIITKSKTAYDVKDIAVEINELMENYGG